MVWYTQTWWRIRTMGKPPSTVLPTELQMAYIDNVIANVGHIRKNRRYKNVAYICYVFHIAIHQICIHIHRGAMGIP
jgi:hypothetical protein